MKGIATLKLCWQIGIQDSDNILMVKSECIFLKGLMMQNFLAPRSPVGAVMVAAKILHHKAFQPQFII